jgi:glutamate-1-semialdehyde 2,1-aminomutase
MFTLFFSEKEIKNFEDVKNSNTARFAKFFRDLLNKNIYFSPSPFEANFISEAHTEAQLDKTLKAIKKVLSK